MAVANDKACSTSSNVDNSILESKVRDEHRALQLSKKSLFTFWKRYVYTKRAHKYFRRRTGINVEKISQINYVNLQQRLRKLSSPVTKAMQSHLSASLRNEDGLTEEEQILFDRLLKGEWYLLHRMEVDEYEEIKKDEVMLRYSSEEKMRRNGFSMSQTIDEILDGVFCTFGPGKSIGLPQFGKVRIDINLEEINMAELTGLFISGCIYYFHCNNTDPREFFGTKYYCKFAECFTEQNGIFWEKYYCFEMPDGEIITHKMDRSSEIFSGKILRKAFCYGLIEKIRQLGLPAWTTILTNISTKPIESLQKLARDIFGPQHLEAHIPRVFNIKQKGIYVTTEETLDNDTGHDEKECLETTSIQIPYTEEIRYSFIFKGEYSKGKFWYLFDEPEELRRFLFAKRSDRARIAPLLGIFISQRIKDDLLLKKVASGYYTISPKHIRLDAKIEGASLDITLIGVIHQDHHEQLFLDFKEYIIAEEEIAEKEVEETLTSLPFEETHQQLVMSFLFDKHKNTAFSANRQNLKRNIDYEGIKSLLCVP